MNISINQKIIRPLLLARLLLSACLVIALGNFASHGAVLPAHSKPHGKSNSEWSAAWWQWAMSHPLTGHPFIDDPAYDASSGQSGPVWFLGTSFGTVERHIKIPAGKMLFIGLLNAEASDLEGLGNTETERRDTANFLANHIIDPAATIDGVPVSKIGRYRVTSPEFTFTAPTPWIFGNTGGTGVSVADGYFFMIAPLSVGTHTIKLSGGFHFAVAEGDPFDFDATCDVTYHITVE